MDRIFPPDDGEHIWQAYMYSYNPDMDKVVTVKHFIRGRYVGKNGIIKLISQYNLTIEKLAYLSGVLLSAVQYGSRQTAVDTELILGKDLSGNISLYLIDFDRSTWRDEENPNTGLSFTEKQIEQELTKPMEDEEFYFGPDEEELYEKFKEGYFKTDDDFGELELAERVIALRDRMNII